MLPCNVVVRQAAGEKVEIATVDPIASMSAIDNAELGAVATQVQGMLKTVIENLE